MASSESNHVPHLQQSHMDRGYGQSTPSKSNLLGTSAATDFGSAPGNPLDSSPLSNTAQQQGSGKFNEEWDASQRGSSILGAGIERENSSGFSQGETLTPSRGGTLKKKASLKKSGSVKRTASRRSSRAGSVRSLALQSGHEHDETHSAFFSPVPTTGNPTEILANRFQAWRKVLKDLIAYFREIQAFYEHKGKAGLKVQNVVNNTITPPVFLRSGGIDDALQVLREFQRNAINESNKSRDIENDVILALTGLRSDLSQKIKEIKGLSSDFKNSVTPEMEKTKRLVKLLQEGLGQSDVDAAQQTGRQDPYLLKLAVDRQIERQIDEESYLHQAYLNLEASGRELEAIIVGEIQKSYNALAGILKREADSAYSTIDELRTGPIAMPKDHEWNSFVEGDDQFVDPRIPIRQPQNIHYPGRDSELAQEVRAGLMERKSKYLKSYTAGWYVLSPTHLHEFKSADKTQAPIMSLFLPEQKLGSHSNPGASSNKFMLKGRQTGSMHRGHSWVLRCESYDTMMAWFEDIKALTEKSPTERKAYVRQHARSISGSSQRSLSRAGSVSSDGNMDEEDEEPFSVASSVAVAPEPKQDVLPRRPQPGGRFPSDLEVSKARGLQVPLSPSSGSSNFEDRSVNAAAAALPGSGVGEHYEPYVQAQQSHPTHAALVSQAAEQDGINPYTSRPLSRNASRRSSHQHNQSSAPTASQQDYFPPNQEQFQPRQDTYIPQQETYQSQQQFQPRQETYTMRHDGVSDAVLAGGAGIGGAAVGAAGYQAYNDHQQDQSQPQPETHREIEPEYAAINPPPSRTFQQQQAEQAAYEATLIAAPDATQSSRSVNEFMMAGGRSHGDITPTTELSLTDVSAPQQAADTQSIASLNPAKKILDPLADDLAREQPSFAAGQDHSGIASISQLHIPGSFA